MADTRDLLVGYLSNLKSPSPDRAPDEVAAEWADEVLRITERDERQAFRDEIWAAWSETAQERHRADAAEIYLNRVRALARQEAVRVEDLRDALDMP